MKDTIRKVLHKEDWMESKYVNTLKNLLDYYFVTMFPRPEAMDDESYEEQVKDAKECLEQYEKLLFPQCVYRYMSCSLRQDQLLIDHQVLSCPVFSDMERVSPIGAITYAISSPSIEVDSVMEEYYIHLWQDIYLSTLRDLLPLYVRNEMDALQESYISPSFGPGFYGMDMGEMEKLYSNLQPVDINMEMRNRTLYPKASGIGLRIFTREKIPIGNTVCKSCRSGQMNCQLCMMNKGKRGEENESNCKEDVPGNSESF